MPPLSPRLFEISNASSLHYTVLVVVMLSLASTCRNSTACLATKQVAFAPPPLLQHTRMEESFETC